MDLKNFFEKLQDGIIVNISVKLIVALMEKIPQLTINYKPKYWKYKMDYFSYFLFTKLYQYFFGIIFPIYGIFYSLFANNDGIPRFHVAYISLVMGIGTIVLFRWVEKKYPKPVRE